MTDADTETITAAPRTLTSRENRLATRYWNGADFFYVTVDSSSIRFTICGPVRPSKTLLRCSTRFTPSTRIQPRQTE